MRRSISEGSPYRMRLIQSNCSCPYGSSRLPQLRFPCMVDGSAFIAVGGCVVILCASALGAKRTSRDCDWKPSERALRLSAGLRDVSRHLVSRALFKPTNFQHVGNRCEGSNRKKCSYENGARVYFCARRRRRILLENRANTKRDWTLKS